MVGAHLLWQLVQEEIPVRATYRDIRRLERVRRVFSYYTAQGDGFFEKIHWVEADINDLMALESAFDQVSQVYHCAAMISFDPGDFRQLRKVNAEGTANVVNLCLSRQVQKLCYASSIATIGKPLNDAPATEEDYGPDRQRNVYALSKLSAEMEVWRGAQEGLPVVIVNPGIILGPGFWQGASGRIFGIAARGPSYAPPGGSGFVGVGDVVQIMVQLMQSSIVNERFIVVAEQLSYRELLGMMAREFNKKGPAKTLPLWGLEILWRLDWLRCLFGGGRRKLTKSNVASLKHPTLYVNGKIKEALQYSFEPLKESIIASCRHYDREHRKLSD